MKLNALVSGLALVVIFNSMLAVAVEPSPQNEPEPTLQSTMKEMNADLKAIVAQIDDVSKNASSTVMAEHFVSLVERAKTFVPDSVASVPEDRRQARVDLYLQMLDGTSKLGQALIECFRADDNERARKVLKELGAAKTEGHGEFK